MIVAQTICVAVGLWIHHRYAVSSIRRAVNEETWARLGQAINDFASADHTSTDTTLAPYAAPLDSLLDRLPPTSGKNASRLILVDSEWTVIHERRNADRDGETPLARGQRVEWKPIDRPSRSTSDQRRGRLMIPDGLHLAMAYPLPDGRGYLLACRASADIDARMAVLTESLPGTTLITLLWTCTLLGIMVYIVVTRFHDQISSEHEEAEVRALRRMESLVRMRDAVIFGLAKLAESRDPETGGHLERMSIYATTLASALRNHPEYREIVTPMFVRSIGISSALHDIGKVGIEDAILLKRGELTEEQRLRMQEHTRIGGECLLQIEQRLGTSNFLQIARQIAMAHHERWDGSGYPEGLREETIPLAARIVAIADVYDALSSCRTYKEPFPHERCVKIIREGSGTAFDPRLVEIWMTIESRFQDIARQYWPSTIDRDDSDTEEPEHETIPDQIEPVLVGAREE